MQIVINTLTLRNFKGTKERTVEFGRNETSIYGANHTGKTTIEDAWFWLLFDKNSEGNSKFEVKPVGMERPQVEVEAVLFVDDRSVKLKKVLTEKWVTRRGFDTETFSGHETTYYIDDIEKKSGEYKAYLDMLISEDMFKRLASADFFLNMKKPDMRNTLLEMAGDIDDYTVIEAAPELSEIVEYMRENDRSIDDMLKLCKQNLTAYNAEQGQITPRIDEINRMLPEEKDWDKLEAGLVKGKQMLQQIDKQIASGHSGAVTARKMQGEISSLENRIDALKKQRLDDANKRYYELESMKTKLDAHIESLNYTISSKKRIEQQVQETIDRHTSSLKGIAEEYKALKAVRKQRAEIEYEHLQSGACDKCGQALPEESLDRINVDNLDRFNKEREEELAKLGEKLEAIAEQGKQVSAKKQEAVEELAKEQAERKHKEHELELAKAALKDTLADMEGKEPAIAIDLTGDNEYDALVEQLNNLKSEMDMPEDKSDMLLQNKEKLTSQMEQIRTMLEGRKERERAQKRIDELKERGQQLAGMIAVEKKRQSLCENYIRTKANLLTGNINQLFENVEFRLFDTQINGGIVDDCTPMINGVEYRDASHSEQLRASMDIVRAMQIHADTYIPYFLDNSEACTYLREMPCQLILLIVSKADKQIRVEKG